MSDIIADVDRTLKEMTKLWNRSIRAMLPDSRPMSYQRFKILRAVKSGARTVADIAETAGSDLSTTGEQLDHLMKSHYVTREPVDLRTFRWGVTKYGAREADMMSTVLDNIREDLIKIAKPRLEMWV
jgi:DNA-binding MarR family transcriptional regulator